MEQPLHRDPEALQQDDRRERNPVGQAGADRGEHDQPGEHAETDEEKERGRRGRAPGVERAGPCQVPRNRDVGEEDREQRPDPGAGPTETRRHRQRDGEHNDAEQDAGG